MGAGQFSRGETVAKIWAYIKANNLQNPANKREILADAKLKPVFDGKDKVSMFETNKHLADHSSSRRSAGLGAVVLHSTVEEQSGGRAQIARAR